MEAEIGKALLSMGTGGTIAGLIFYFYRGKQTELDAANVRIAALQDKIVSILQSQLESEPQRKETLAGIARSIESQGDLLKERLKP